MRGYVRVSRWWLLLTTIGLSVMDGWAWYKVGWPPTANQQNAAFTVQIVVALMWLGTISYWIYTRRFLRE